MIGVLAGVCGLAAAILLWTDSTPAAEALDPRSVYVIDGDTIDLGGERFRLVGFDTPETYSPQCPYEKALGEEATQRLRTLITSGEFLELVVLPGRDRYDRGLARLYVGRTDVGDILISEGLARAYDGGKRLSWCR